MEIIEQKNSGRMAPLGAVLLALGVALLGWSLYALPAAPAWGFPWEFLLAVGGLKLIIFGGRFLDSLLPALSEGRRRYTAEYRSRIPFALMVIVAGAMLMGFNSGVLAHEWKRVFFSWQMLLVVIGLAEFTQMRVTSGTVLVAVGGFFILHRLADIYPGIEQFAHGGMWWPLLLIVAGVLVLGNIFFKPHGGCRHRVGGRCSHRHGNRRRGGEGAAHDGDAENVPEGGGADDARARYEGARHGGKHRTSGVIDIEVIFGGCEQVYLDPVFRGGKIATVFGGVKLDLRRTGLPEGETHLRVESLFGGVEIDAPEEWIIEVRSEAVFGGFNDKRLPPVGAGYTDGRKLVVSASCVFGGGEIK